MLWRMVLDWFTQQCGRSLASVMPLTLVTLEPARMPEVDELAFYAASELAVWKIGRAGAP